MTPHRRDLLRATLLLPVLAACKKKGGSPTPTPTPTGPIALEDVGPGSAPGLEIGEAVAELLPGNQRYAFGLVGPDGPLAGATVTVYLGTDAAKPPAQSVPAVELQGTGLSDRGLYRADVSFPQAGSYLVAVVAQTKDGSFKGGTRVDVLAKSKSPVPGQRAISVKTPTTADPAGASPLCSRRPTPCVMHTISLDKALKNGKPTLVVFAAPAFCQTELCGPDVEILDTVARRYAGKANFIHVEAYRGATTPTNGKLAPALEAYHFDSEPWLYVIDRTGVVSDRISSAFVTDEAVSALAKVGVS